MIRNVVLMIVVGLVCIGMLEAGGYASLYFSSGHTVDRNTLRKSLNVARPAMEKENRRSDDGRPDEAYMQHHVLHPYLGYVMNYDVREQSFNGVPVDVRVNNYGFLGDMPERSAKVDSLSIGLFGGSVAAEVYIYARDILVRELEKYPDFSNKRIKLVSVALGGMRQPQQLMALNYLLSMGDHFDIVINLDGFNEVALPFSENVRFHVSPYYPSRWHFFAEERESEHAARVKSEIFGKMQRLAAWAHIVSRWPLRDSYFALAAWKVYSNRNLNAQRALEEEVRNQYREEGRLSAQQAGPPYYRIKPERVMPDSVALWKRTSLQMLEICTARGIAYYHILQPNQYVKGSKVLSAWEMQHAYSPPNYWYRSEVENGYPVLLSAGRELLEAGVAWSDATGIFRGIEVDIYKDTCCHYNEEGNILLAKHIARFIGDNWSGETSVAVTGQ